MTQLRINVDATKAQRLLEASRKGLHRAVGNFARQGGELVRGTWVQALRERAKHPTGRSAASIQVTTTPTGAIIEPTARYGPWGFEVVDKPTRPHDIFPRTKQALTIPTARDGGPARIGQRKGNLVAIRTVGGKRATKVVGPVILRTHVHHPGTRGLATREETTRRVQQPLTALFDRLVELELRRAGGGA